MEQRQRLDYVDGLRGLAALVVVLQHAAQLVQNAGIGYYAPLLETINLGRFGVVLFFLISGLVIPFSFRGERPLRDFAISRLFRLYPAYWLSIPVLAALAVHNGRIITADMVLANLTMLQGLWHGPNIGYGYWTLTYEMSFYIACGALFWLRKLDDVRINGLAALACLLLAGVELVMVLRDGSATVDTRAPYFVAMFLIGMLLRRSFIDRCPVAGRWALVLVPLALAVGVVTSGWIVPTGENANRYLRPLMLTTGTVLPLVVFVLALWLKPRPGRAGAYLARISYSLYLFQDVALLLLPAVLPPGDWPVLYVLAVIAVSGAIASLVYHLVERPMIDLGRALAGRGTRLAGAG